MLSHRYGHTRAHTQAKPVAFLSSAQLAGRQASRQAGAVRQRLWRHDRCISPAVASMSFVQKVEISTRHLLCPTCSRSRPAPLFGRRLYRDMTTSRLSMRRSASSSTKNLVCNSSTITGKPTRMIKKHKPLLFPACLQDQFKMRWCCDLIDRADLLLLTPTHIPTHPLGLTCCQPRLFRLDCAPSG